MRKVYATMINTDMTEGRGPLRVIALFKDIDIAQMVADAHEPYGKSGQFNGVQEYVLYDSYTEYDEGTRQALRKSALNKLTSKEKEALGLS